MPASDDRSPDRAAAAARTAERALALRALFTLAFLAYVGGQFADGTVTRTDAAVLYVVILVLSIVAHEIAHAVVGRAVGAEVTGMRLGFGPRLTPAGAWLDLRPIVVAAHVTYIPPRGARRGQLVAIGVAGIVVHLVLIAVAVSLGSHAVWVRELLLANVVALASNAVPLPGGFTSTSGGPNDGLQLLRLLRARGSLIGPSDPDVRSAAQAYDLGGAAAAGSWIDALDRPDAPAVRLLLVQALLGAGRYADAASLAAGAAERTRPWAGDEARARSWALATLTTDGPLPRPAGERAAQEAAERGMASIPADAPAGERASVAVTLALVRLAQGRYDEAGRIAGWASAGLADADRVLLLAATGFAELATGARAAAEAALHRAMSLEPPEQRSPLVRMLAHRIAATPHG